ncbi:MAG: Rrf2 family transcriptional regulator [Lachnospiraceae bacterium]|nr:Rrf2 family transcriptional regulator [Lachnospiraceae bacterium]
MISTKGRYALRLMVDLASQNTEDYVPLKEVSERQGVSEKYMEIIIKELVKAKLIKGLRGKGGGYKLLRKPDEYPIGEILEAAGEQLATVACLLPGAETCERENSCQTIGMWRTFDNMTHDFFYGISLEDLMSGNIKKQKGKTPSKQLAK